MNYLSWRLSVLVCDSNVKLWEGHVLISRTSNFFFKKNCWTLKCTIYPSYLNCLNVNVGHFYDCSLLAWLINWLTVWLIDCLAKWCEPTQYIYIYTHKHTYIHTYVYIHTHTQVYTCVCVRARVRVCVRVYRQLLTHQNSNTKTNTDILGLHTSKFCAFSNAPYRTVS